jgi:hypothetical protein
MSISTVIMMKRIAAGRPAGADGGDGRELTSSSDHSER